MELKPTPHYETVREIFRLYAEAQPETSHGKVDEDKIDEYFKRRDELGLEFHNYNGKKINTGWIHILDFSVEAGEQGYELHVQINDPKFRQQLESNSENYLKD